MKSIAIVSLNDLKAKQFAKRLSEKLNLRFVDIAEEFEKILLLSAKLSVFETDILEQKEKQIISRCDAIDNVVFIINNNMFLSNANYELCKNMQIVLLEQENLDKTSQNLQNLIKKHAKFSVLENEIEKFISLLKG